MSVDISALCARVGIAADRLAEGPALACGRVYLARPGGAAERDRWLAALERESGVVAVACKTPLDWLEVRDAPDEPTFQGLLAEADRLLTELDAWRPDPATTEAPDRIGAVQAWAGAHPEGAPLSSLVEALDAAPTRELALPARDLPRDPGPVDEGPLYEEGIALVRTDHDPPALLAAIGFGGFNACPPAPFHLARLRRWARDHDARLIALTQDGYALRIGRPPHGEDELRRVLDEQGVMAADERPQPGSLGRLRTWRFWWD